VQCGNGIHHLIPLSDFITNYKDLILYDLTVGQKAGFMRLPCPSFFYVEYPKMSLYRLIPLSCVLTLTACQYIEKKFENYHMPTGYTHLDTTPI
jgi:hypothetical protein